MVLKVQGFEDLFEPSAEDGDSLLFFGNRQMPGYEPPLDCFDDFKTNGINPNLWTKTIAAPGTISVSNGIALLSVLGAGSAKLKMDIGKNLADYSAIHVTMKVKFEFGAADPMFDDELIVGFTNAAENKYSWFRYASATYGAAQMVWEISDGAMAAPVAHSVVEGKWYNLEFYMNAAGSWFKFLGYKTTSAKTWTDEVFLFFYSPWASGMVDPVRIYIDKCLMEAL